MRIAILAYPTAPNYGANLQVLSTVGYLRRMGHSPLVLRYEAEDFVAFYQHNTPSSAYSVFRQFQAQYMPLSKVCRSAEQIAQVLQEEHIDAVIVGSDAVAQHHTLWERLLFPTRHLVSVQYMTADRLFPNPFWGTFWDYMEHPIPLALMSASSQDSRYRYFLPSTRRAMYARLQQFGYISVRDHWTAEMYQTVSRGAIQAGVTPDPVFAFQSNCADIIPTKEEILSKFGLPESYFLLSFKDNRTVSQQWFSCFENEANYHNIACVSMPFPQGMLCSHRVQYTLPSALSPLDWYALIRYSKGYVGHNMHPIVSSLHNANPFFAFDNYGTRYFNGFLSSDYSSKIRHLLCAAHLEDYRVSCIGRRFSAPAAVEVVSRLLSFPTDKAEKFSSAYLALYENMMSNILQSFELCE